MIRRRAAVALLLALLGTLGAGAQSRARVAIIPLNAVGVSGAESDALTALLETAMVSTAVFEIIEQARAAEILEAQEYSIAECTEDTCAVQLGRLLAAQQIVLGQISRVGSTYVITAKLIDVTTGRNVKAEKVQADSLEGLTGAADLLAYTLAGLTFRGGGETQIATAFGELFVETVPPEADVYVNGILRGRSPLLIGKVPAGSATVEARRGSLHMSRQVQLSGSGLVEVSIDLTVALGRLFLKTTEKDLKVYIDGSYFADLGSGLLKDIAAGEHGVALRGPGVFWQERLAVTADQTTTAEVVPYEVGTVEYRVPEGVAVEVAGPDYRRVATGAGVLEDVPTGTYSATASGEGYKTATATIAVRRTEAGSFRPAMEHTEEYLAARAAAERDAEYRRLTDLVNRAGQPLQSDARLADADVLHAEACLGEVEASPHRFDDLRARASAILADLRKRRQEEDRADRAAALTARRDQLIQQIQSVERRRRPFVVTSLVSLGVGALSLGGTVVAALMEYRAYNEYGAAIYTADAIRLREQTVTWRIATGVTGGAGGLGISLSCVLALLAPRPAALRAELGAVLKELARIATD
jgi:hypothetical protein